VVNVEGQRGQALIIAIAARNTVEGQHARDIGAGGSAITASSSAGNGQ